jgi:iron complex transport system substrate-binding protein
LKNCCLLLLLWCALAALNACAKRPPVRFPPGPRIISTDPSATQILLQIGAGKTIVGVSPWDKPLLPKAMQNLPVVGGYLNLDEELVLRLAPNALILQQAPRKIVPGILAMARQNKIRIVNIKINTFRQLYATTRTLGHISGHQKQAAKTIISVKRQLAQLARNRPRNQPRVVYLISTQPMMIVGADNFMDQELTLAGGINAGARCGTGFPTITRETLVQLHPQILLISKPGQPPAKSTDDPRISPWLTLPISAARNKRVYLITWPQAQMLTLKVPEMIRRLRHVMFQTARRTKPASSAKAAK